MHMSFIKVAMATIHEYCRRYLTHLSTMFSKIVLRYIYAHVVTLLYRNDKYSCSCTPVVRKPDCGSKVVYRTYISTSFMQSNFTPTQAKPDATLCQPRLVAFQLRAILTSEDPSVGVPFFAAAANEGNCLCTPRKCHAMPSSQLQRHLTGLFKLLKARAVMTWGSPV